MASSEPKSVGEVFERLSRPEADGGVGMTKDEINSIVKACSSEEGMKLLSDYMRDIEDPETRREMDKEIASAEARGSLPPGRVVVRPQPVGAFRFPLRSSTGARTGDAVVNICASEDIQPFQVGKGRQLSMPLACGPMRSEVLEGRPVQVVEVVAATATIAVVAGPAPAGSPSLQIRLVFWRQVKALLEQRLGGTAARAKPTDDDPVPVTLPSGSASLGAVTSILVNASESSGLLTKEAQDRANDPAAAAAAAAAHMASVAAASKGAASSSVTAAAAAGAAVAAAAAAPAASPAAAASQRARKRPPPAARRLAPDGAAPASPFDAGPAIKDPWPCDVIESGQFEMADSFSDPRLARALRRPKTVKLRVALPPMTAAADLKAELAPSRCRFDVSHGTTPVLAQRLPYPVQQAGCTLRLRKKEGVLLPPVSWLQDETHLSLVLQARPAGDESLAVVWYARPGDGEDADGDRLASAVDVVFLAGSDGPTSSAAWAAQLEEAASSRNAAARGRAAGATRASSPVLVGGLVPEEGAGGVLGVAASGAPADSAAPGVSGTRGAAGGAAIAYWLRLVLPAPVRPAGSSADAASLNACLVARKDTDAIWPGPVDEAAATELAGWHAQWASPAELVGLAGEVAAATAASGAEAAAAASPASEPARMPDKAAPGTAPHQGTTGDGGKVAQSQPAAEPTLAAASPSPTGVGARRPGAPKPTAAAKALMFELD
ncbi:hypothetical protein FNF27_03992 [Cafeteria roenbergensis]|uniref:PIH1 N-terminal domain-containing protein n=1 Tax=Cafeteria roenbergensis TaxID=33653 RepID=A0A5A8ECY3_CAFRO|nr:hypothetical protein FNF27_03992 [Cafeteria roenbergensis]